MKKADTRNIISRITIVTFLLLSSFLPLRAQEQTPLRDKEKRGAVADVTSGYNEWQTVSLSGKLKMDILPLSPSVKIFMERDSLIRISLRAPLVGEVGRAEIDADSILVVNKLKKTYVKESIQKALAYYPGTISDIQDIFLGRVVIPGYGLLREEGWQNVEVYAEDPEGFSIYPGEEFAIEGFDYGYLIAADSRPRALAVVPREKENVIVGVSYDYPNDGETLTISYQTPKRTLSGQLELDAPEWNGKGFDAVKLNSRYRRLDFKQFLKSF